ncbi:MAG: radical SAM family heme chaperone HemW, partial [Thioalkalispiraceae bacterium]
IDRLVCGLRARLVFSNDIEITMEANPGSVEQARFNEFYDAGINRLSIGIQSFNDDHLQKLGRIHDRNQAIAAAEIAHDAGFSNFNLDLMFGLPGQTLEQALEDINTAIALEPSHLSHYQLTIEPNTLFYHHPPAVPDDELSWQMQELCQQQMAKHDYQQYEVSAYARLGKQCQHNRNYWQFGDYLGIGAGAHEKITLPQQQKIERQWKVKQPRQYLECAASASRIQGQRLLSRQDAAFEFMLNALRLTDGFEIALFSEHTGLQIPIIEKPLREAQQKNWIEWQTHRIKPTSKGMQYLNDLVSLFLPE